MDVEIEALIRELAVAEEEAAATFDDVMAVARAVLDTLDRALAILVSCEDSKVVEEPATDTTIATLVMEEYVGGGVGRYEGAAVGDADGNGVGAAGVDAEVTTTVTLDVDVIPMLAFTMRL